MPTVTAVADALFTSLRDSGAEGVSAFDDEQQLNAEAGEAERIYGSEEWTFRY